MSKKLLTPKFLTQEIAKTAVDAVTGLVSRSAFGLELHGPHNDQFMCHVVILAPSMEDARAKDYPHWPDYPIKPSLIFEASYGEKEEWPFPFDKIAHCKALQLWGGRNDGGTDIKPHLLFAGDTPYWGGVKREGIVVSCSGFSCHHDRMVAGMILDLIVGMACEAWMKSADQGQHVCFLT